MGEQVDVKYKAKAKHSCPPPRNLLIPQALTETQLLC